MDYYVWELGNYEFNYDLSMLERAISFFEGDVPIANACYDMFASEDGRTPNVKSLNADEISA